jgi:hypothetical protein
MAEARYFAPVRVISVFAATLDVAPINETV